MQTRTYYVTNNSEGSICITGRTRIDIPGLCKDLPIVLPDTTAKATVARLKQKYPLLKFSDKAPAKQPEPEKQLEPGKQPEKQPEKNGDAAQETGNNSGAKKQATNTKQETTPEGQGQDGQAKK